MGATYDPGLTTPGMDPTVLLVVCVATLIVYILTQQGGRR